MIPHRINLNLVQFNKFVFPNVSRLQINSRAELFNSSRCVQDLVLLKKGICLIYDLFFPTRNLPLCQILHSF